MGGLSVGEEIFVGSSQPRQFHCRTMVAGPYCRDAFGGRSGQSTGQAIFIALRMWARTASPLYPGQHRHEGRGVRHIASGGNRQNGGHGRPLVWSRWYWVSHTRRQVVINLRGATHYETHYDLITDGRVAPFFRCAGARVGDEGCAAGHGDAHAIARERGAYLVAEVASTTNMARAAYPAETTSGTLARRFVSQWCRRWAPPYLVADAELVVTELVENAVRHGRTECEVTVEEHEGHVRIAVRDGSLAPPRLRDRGSLQAGGRGLLLIDRLSSGWGVEFDESGKTVWAVLGPSPVLDDAT